MFSTLIPLILVIGMILFIVTIVFGWGRDSEYYGGGGILSRYWWIIMLLVLPLPLIVLFGIDLVAIISMLIVFTVIGAVVFYLFEYGMPEMPKGDPVKNGIRWLRKNFRW